MLAKRREIFLHQSDRILSDVVCCIRSKSEHTCLLAKKKSSTWGPLGHSDVERQRKALEKISYSAARLRLRYLCGFRRIPSRDVFAKRKEGLFIGLLLHHEPPPLGTESAHMGGTNVDTKMHSVVGAAELPVVKPPLGVCKLQPNSGPFQRSRAGCMADPCRR